MYSNMRPGWLTGHDDRTSCALWVRLRRRAVIGAMNIGADRRRAFADARIES